MIENHAGELTDSVIRDLKSNSKTPSFHDVSNLELCDQCYEVYHNLSRWLTELSEDTIKAFYFRHAKLRYEEGIPQSEVVYALILKKTHLRDYIRSSGMVDSAVDLLQEQELQLLIGSFFDKAIYYTVDVYQLERGRELAEIAARQSATVHS